MKALIISFLMFVALFLFPSKVHSGNNSITKQDRLSYIRYIASVVGIDSSLLLAICYKESHLRYNAHNSNDAGSPSYGVCQIKKGTYKAIKRHYNLSNEVKNISVPYHNLYVAAHLIKYHSEITCKKSVNKDSCIAHAYNTGKAPKRKGNKYARDVLSFRQQFANMGDNKTICWRGVL